MVVEWAIRYDADLVARIEPGETDGDTLYKNGLPQKVTVVDDSKPDAHDNVDNVSALSTNYVLDPTPNYIIVSAPKDVFD
jgi:hypothetical protein